MLNLNQLQQQSLLPGTKGLALSQPLVQRDIAQQGWNILRADTSFPVAVLKQSALEHNLRWMKNFCADMQVQLAPHGKTTMCPQLFDMQLDNGAWGITLATVNQTLVAHRFGVKRVLLANQLVSRSDTKAVLQLMKSDPAFQFYALVDSLEALDRMAECVHESEIERPLPLLIELGFQGGRSGCRQREDAMLIARAIHASPCLTLAGIEGYEGLMVSQNRSQDLQGVHAFLKELTALTIEIDAEALFDLDEIILSAGGSAYFDLVGHDFQINHPFSRKLTPILRSGCYVTHDHGFYHGLLKEMQERDRKLKAAALRPALEIWSMVQSRPEADLAILSMGKRDASYDIDLPVPILSHRPDIEATPQALPEGCKIEKMNDQHAYLRLPKNSSLCQHLQVGDLIACGISHPCTTFDKWPLILLVDDHYNVGSAVNTFF